MTWIETIHEDDAEGKLAKVYVGAREYAGKIPNIMRAVSLHPEALQGSIALFDALMFRDSTLTRAEREMIAVVASAINRCEY